MTSTLRNYLKRVADAFDSATHAPDSPAVYVAYGKLKAELLAQFEVLSAFVDVSFSNKDPYQTSEDMLTDIMRTRRLRVYRSAELLAGHPFTEIAPNGETFNTIFRAVHDGLAHFPGGHSFSASGEFRAYRAHARLLSDIAIHALASETLGQNAWYVYGTHAKGVYAEQKACLLPWSLVLESLTLSAE